MKSGPHSHHLGLFACIRRFLALVAPFVVKNWRTRLAMLGVLLLMLVETMVVMVFPWTFSWLIKYASEATAHPDEVKQLFFLWLLAFVVKKNVPRMQHIVFFEVINEAIKGVRINLIQHLHRTPYMYWSQYAHTEVLSASTRVSMSIRGFMRASLLKLPTKVLTVVSLVSAVVYILPESKELLLFGTGFGLAFLTGMWGIVHFLRSRKRLWDVSDHVLVRSGGSLRGGKGALFYLASEHEALEKVFTDEARGWRVNNFHQHGLLILQSSIMVASMAVLFGAITLDKVGLLKTTLVLLYKELVDLTNQVRILVGYAWDMRKVFAMLELPTYHQSVAIPIEYRGAVIVAKNVGFGYKEGQALFGGLNLAVGRGEKVMISGSSGTGKSTLCHLLAGLCIPQEGVVRIHGKDTSVLNPLEVGKVLHFVDQEATLQVGSMVENLHTPAGQESSKEVLAYLGEDMQRVVGEEGRGLSGGERQRIFLARCLEQKPQIVILDETFAYLDDESARKLFAMLYRRIPTVIMVTHRISFTQYFDTVYRFQGGKLQRIKG